jgi:hypothetical protein
MRLVRGTLGMLMLAFALPASASPCPANVTASVLKAHAGAVVTECKQETEHGKVQYEVKITSKDGARKELDVDPGGKILLTEEYVELASVPQAVVTAFTAKFPGAKASRAEKQTASDGKVTYELAFGSGAARKEATFSSDGAFLEEE